MTENQPLILSELPFEIPPSLKTFVEQFESDPGKGTERLETYLKKRSLDAIGHFLLAWLYHKQGNETQARKNALKAKCFAPGSPLIENLHYYLIHPKKFKAQVPLRSGSDFSNSNRKQSKIDYDLKLDTLISRLTAADTLKVEVSDDDPADNVDLSIQSQMVNDLASETLAHIYEKQGKYEEAIDSLKNMQKVKPAQADHYQKDIDRLEKIITTQKKDQEEK